ncbi:hypothetical protein AcW1_003777 [Taiwanofungus camphoratus]|nr:hypothetical protein AcW1_003777 [Antrodia cinnamomea]
MATVAIVSLLHVLLPHLYVKSAMAHRTLLHPLLDFDATETPSLASTPYPSHTPTYTVKRCSEVIPGSGVLIDGRVTANHPFVCRYLLALSDTLWDCPAPSGARLSQPRPAMNKKGKTSLSKVENVCTLLNREGLNKLACECVVALAAMRVYPNPHHAAHFGLWDKSVRRRTAQTVHKIYYHEPPVIESPMVWIGLRECLWALGRLQVRTFPPKLNDGQNDMRVLRKRKASAALEETPTELNEDQKLLELPTKKVWRSTAVISPSSIKRNCAGMRIQKR